MQLLELFWDLELRNSVLCMHGEGISLLLTRLLADVLVVEEPLEWPKGCTWLLERTGPHRIRGRFLAPLVHDGRSNLLPPTPAPLAVERTTQQGGTDGGPDRDRVPGRDHGIVGDG